MKNNQQCQKEDYKLQESQKESYHIVKLLTSTKKKWGTVIFEIFIYQFRTIPSCLSIQKKFLPQVPFGLLNVPICILYFREEKGGGLQVR